MPQEKCSCLLPKRGMTSHRKTRSSAIADKSLDDCAAQLKVKVKGKDVKLYSASTYTSIPLKRISSLKLSRRAVFRSPHSLRTQPYAVTQQPATGSTSQLV